LAVRRVDRHQTSVGSEKTQLPGWILGAAGDSCTDTCGRDKVCNPIEMSRVNTVEILKALMPDSLSKFPCAEIKMGLGGRQPMIHTDSKNCYVDGKKGIMPKCGQKVGVHQRRLCYCEVSHLGDEEIEDDIPADGHAGGNVCGEFVEKRNAVWTKRPQSERSPQTGEKSTLAESAAACRDLCRQEAHCVVWSWRYGTSFGASKKTCVRWTRDQEEAEYSVRQHAKWDAENMYDPKNSSSWMGAMTAGGGATSGRCNPLGDVCSPRCGD